MLSTERSKNKQKENLAAGSVTRIFLSVTTVTVSGEADAVLVRRLAAQK